MNDYEKYFIYLEGLRKSGQTNMFSAAPYLRKRFSLSDKEAKKVLLFWIEHYSELAENYGWK